MLGREEISPIPYFATASSWIFTQRRALADIQHVEHRFLAEKHEAAEALLVFRRHLHFAQRASRSPGWTLARFNNSNSRSVPADFIFFMSFSTRSSRFSTWPRSLTIKSKSMFLMSRSGSIGPTWGIGVIFESADHVSQRVYVAQVRGKRRFVQSLFAQGRDIGVLHAGMDQFLRVVERRQTVQAVVGNLGDAQMRLARIAAALRHLLLGQHYEQRGFAYLRQAYDSGFHELAFSRQPSALSLSFGEGTPLAI